MWALCWQGSESVQSGRSSRTLVVGLGATGLAAARYLASRGEEVLVIDSRAAPPGLAALRRTHPHVEVVLESLDSRWLAGVHRVVLSPGLGADIPIAQAARARGIELVSDIELFARAARAPVLAVTGSNGKSTVATLLAAMLEGGGKRVAAGGNLGPPALELLAAGEPDAYVLEISSFQMEATESLRPRAAAVLNVSPDHLDRHGSITRYAELKAKLLHAAARAVYNFDDARVREMGQAHPNAVAFSIREPLARGYAIVEHGGERWLARDRDPLIAARGLRLRGTHNEANALAALALADALDHDRRAALAALARFPGLPHRCQWVAERSGVGFINDSKGTNVGAVVAALEGLAGPLILIAGGVAKGAQFAPLAEAGRGKLKAAVLIGEAAAALERTLAAICVVRRAPSMRAAVEAAWALASPGDTVLLSPACASFDMFVDYRERGERFVQAVARLPA